MDERHEVWREVITSAVQGAEEGQPQRLEIILDVLCDQEEASQMLKEKGYGSAAENIVDRIKTVPPRANQFPQK